MCSHDIQHLSLAELDTLHKAAVAEADHLRAEYNAALEVLVAARRALLAAKLDAVQLSDAKIARRAVALASYVSQLEGEANAQ